MQTNADDTMGVGVVLTHEEIRTIVDALSHRAEHLANRCYDCAADGQIDMALKYAQRRDDAHAVLQKLRDL